MQGSVLAFRKTNYFILLFLFLQIGVFGQIQTPRYISMTANTNGYYECVPNDYNNPGNSTVYPVIIFVHGLGEVGDGSASQLPKVLVNGPPKLINQGTFPSSFTVNGQTFSFIVISPQFAGWPSAINVSGVIDYVVNHYRVDENRIYLTGLSMGGGATWDYAGYSAANANRLAAILPVCGASSPSTYRANIIAAASLPVWATHNLNDPTCPVSYTNDYINYILNAPIPSSVPPKKTIFNASGHDAWSTTYNPNWKEDGVHNVYEWMLLQQRNNVILPVNLSSYTASLTAPDRVTISWTTAQEQNNSYFTIEKSTDGLTFTTIGQVPGTNNPVGSSYSYIDQLPLPGDNYYRLSQTDMDGKTTYYAIKKVTVDNLNSKAIILYPNPAKENLNLVLNFPETGQYTASIYQADGKIVQQIQLNKTSSYIQQSFNISEIAGGYYLLEIRGTDFVKSISFIKQ